MVTLYFDSGNLLDCFDNPNCFFDENGIGRRREPGDPGYVEWYPPGYVPPAPERKNKPRRRSTLTAVENPEPATAMSFQYIITPNPSNSQRPFRARVKMGPQVGEGQVLAEIAADSTKPAADVQQILQSAAKVIIGHMRRGCSIEHLLGLFRAVPSVTGSFATSNPSGEEVKAGVTFNLVVGPEALAAMLEDLTVEKVGESGTVKPEIENIVLSPGGTPNVYSHTAGLKCSGDHLRGSGPNQTWPSVSLLDQSLANPIPLTVIACSQTEMLIAPPPAGATGIRRLKIVAGWDSDLEFIYPIPLPLLGT